ncbi:unnamed protein product [Lupinus luteus]|uniref:non-specific serine/threonine protein kinase n=1 Tax=Lupinus luteus TaxID=3873 RepID=A0AAV1W478_LUPLU
MINKTISFAKAVCCCCCHCFGLIRRRCQRLEPTVNNNNNLSQGLLLGDDSDVQACPKRSLDILNSRLENGMTCKQFAVKETHNLVLSKDKDGNKMINEYIRVCKIGSGAYGKVALYRSSVSGNDYAMKAFHKPQLLKRQVAGSETAMTDVLCEVLIMKMLEHPNIVNLIEVIDDPESEHLYIVLEYVEDKWIFLGSGPACGLGEETARRYLRDIVSGLMYLHGHNIIHGDINHDNLLITRHGTVKIADFNVSQAFEDDNDELVRVPGTPVFTAPECIVGPTYHGKASDTWAVGIILYCMILGEYPFLGGALLDTQDRIVKDDIVLPNDMNPLLKNLIEGLLVKDPRLRMTLSEVAEHSWVIGDEGPIPEYLCWCQR